MLVNQKCNWSYKSLKPGKNGKDNECDEKLGNHVKFLNGNSKVLNNEINVSLESPFQNKKILAISDTLYDYEETDKAESRKNTKKKLTKKMRNKNIIKNSQVSPRISRPKRKRKQVNYADSDSDSCIEKDSSSDKFNKSFSRNAGINERNCAQWDNNNNSDHSDEELVLQTRFSDKSINVKDITDSIEGDSIDLPSSSNKTNVELTSTYPLKSQLQNLDFSSKNSKSPLPNVSDLEDDTMLEENLCETSGELINESFSPDTNIEQKNALTDDDNSSDEIFGMGGVDLRSEIAERCDEMSSEIHSMYKELEKEAFRTENNFTNGDVDFENCPTYKKFLGNQSVQGANPGVNNTHLKKETSVKINTEKFDSKNRDTVKKENFNVTNKKHKSSENGLITQFTESKNLVTNKGKNSKKRIEAQKVEQHEPTSDLINSIMKDFEVMDEAELNTTNEDNDEPLLSSGEYNNSNENNDGYENYSADSNLEKRLNIQFKVSDTTSSKKKSSENHNRKKAMHLNKSLNCPKDNSIADLNKNYENSDEHLLSSGEYNNSNEDNKVHKNYFAVSNLEKRLNIQSKVCDTPSSKKKSSENRSRKKAMQLSKYLNCTKDNPINNFIKGNNKKCEKNNVLTRNKVKRNTVMNETDLLNFTYKENAGIEKQGIENLDLDTSCDSTFIVSKSKERKHKKNDEDTKKMRYLDKVPSVKSTSTDKKAHYSNAKNTMLQKSSETVKLNCNKTKLKPKTWEDLETEFLTNDSIQETPDKVYEDINTSHFDEEYKVSRKNNIKKNVNFFSKLSKYETIVSDDFFNNQVKGFTPLQNQIKSKKCTMLDNLDTSILLKSPNLGIINKTIEAMKKCTTSLTPFNGTFKWKEHLEKKDVLSKEYSFSMHSTVICNSGDALNITEETDTYFESVGKDEGNFNENELDVEGYKTLEKVDILSWNTNDYDSKNIIARRLKVQKPVRKKNNAKKQCEIKDAERNTENSQRNISCRSRTKNHANENSGVVDSSTIDNLMLALNEEIQSKSDEYLCPKNTVNKYNFRKRKYNSSPEIKADKHKKNIKKSGSQKSDSALKKEKSSSLNHKSEKPSLVLARKQHIEEETVKQNEQELYDELDLMSSPNFDRDNNNFGILNTSKKNIKVDFFDEETKRNLDFHSEEDMFLNEGKSNRKPCKNEIILKPAVEGDMFLNERNSKNKPCKSEINLKPTVSNVSCQIKHTKHTEEDSKKEYKKYLEKLFQSEETLFDTTEDKNSKAEKDVNSYQANEMKLKDDDDDDLFSISSEESEMPKISSTQRSDLVFFDVLDEEDNT